MHDFLFPVASSVSGGAILMLESIWLDQICVVQDESSIFWSFFLQEKTVNIKCSF